MINKTNRVLFLNLRKVKWQDLKRNGRIGNGDMHDVKREGQKMVFQQETRHLMRKRQWKTIRLLKNWKQSAKKICSVVFVARSREKKRLQKLYWNRLLWEFNLKCLMVKCMLFVVFHSHTLSWGFRVCSQFVFCFTVLYSGFITWKTRKAMHSALLWVPEDVQGDWKGV